MVLQKKSQGEIFGVALMFVVIVLGIIVYSQIAKFSPDRSEQTAKSQEYELLSQTTMDTLMEVSTGCFVERNRDSVSDLINYCISNFGGFDPQIQCEDIPNPVGACEHSKEIINDILFGLFEGYDLDNDNVYETGPIIGRIPFNFSIEIPGYANANMNGYVSTNSGGVNLRREGYKKAPSGIYVWESSYREVYVDLYLYYR